MKRLPYFSHYHLIVIVLVVMVLLTSCKQLGQSNIPPAAGEIPTPGSIEPGIELSSNYLICPIISSTAIIIPPAPYDEDLGDCALRGKSAEIEVWLTALEQIAASCQANREPNWADTLAARDNLDFKIDELTAEEIETVTPDVDDVWMDNPSSSEACPIYEAPVLLEESESEDHPTHFYTNWLKTIGENVGEYCTMIDELVKPLWQACDEINFYQDCQAPNPEQYHTIIEMAMNNAQTKYDQSEFFYTHTLQTTGWGNFRTYFSEASIECPLDQAIDSLPIFTFDTNAFCRIGPNPAYEGVTIFLQDQSVQIDGKNQSEPRWWWVSIPDSMEHCWVSDSTGSAAGFLEDLETVAAPPLRVSPVCSKDLGESACVAAGGKWVKIDIPDASYCNCK